MLQGRTTLHEITDSTFSYSFPIAIMKRELPRGTNDEKKLRAIVSARSTSNPVQNYSETSNDPFRPSLGPGIPQYNFHHQVAPGADMADSESRVYGRPSVLPQSSYDFTTMREEPREDTRIQKTSYRRHSLDYGERHSMNEGDILREGGGDIVLHGIVGETTSETTRDKHASSPPFAIKMRSSAYPKSDQYDIDLNLSFPVKLHMILSDPQYQECVEWAPHGRAWKVLNPRALESAVIPKFFRSDKYSSFMRQVRVSDFVRVRVSMCACSNILAHDVIFIPNLAHIRKSNTVINFLLLVFVSYTLAIHRLMAGLLTESRMGLMQTSTGIHSSLEGCLASRTK